MASVPLTLMAFAQESLARPAFILNTVGTYALFPLLFQPAEIPLKLTVFLTHSVVSYHLFGSAIGSLEVLYLLGLAPLFAFTEVVHPVWLAPRLAFLPLLITSVYCAVGVLYAWVRLYTACWRSEVSTM